MEEVDFQFEQDTTRKAMTKIFQAARAGNVVDLASYVAYKGNDKTRSLKVLADPDIEDDNAYLQRIIKRISRYGEGAEGYSLSSFYVETDSDGTWFVWEVIFNKKVDRKICYFRFFALENRKLVLGDIDS